MYRDSFYSTHHVKSYGTSGFIIHPSNLVIQAASHDVMRPEQPKIKVTL